MIETIMDVQKGAYKKGELCRMNVTQLMSAAVDARVDRHIQSLGGIRNIGKLLHKVIEQNLSPYIIDKPKLVKGYQTYTFDPYVLTE